MENISYTSVEMLPEVNAKVDTSERLIIFRAVAGGSARKVQSLSKRKAAVACAKHNGGGVYGQVFVGVSGGLRYLACSD